MQGNNPHFAPYMHNGVFNHLREVVDFFDFGIGELRWPVFNFADTFVTVGIAIIIGTLLGALAGEGLVHYLGMDAEFTPMAGGIAGFVLAVWLVRILLRKTSAGAQTVQPVMLRILAK